jgi:hypothetical protein
MACINSPRTPVDVGISKGEHDMAALSQIIGHMEAVSADGAHVGTVDKVEGNRIKLTKADNGSHSDHQHYVSGGLAASLEGNQVPLSANGSNAALMEEEKGAGLLSDMR